MNLQARILPGLQGHEPPKPCLIANSPYSSMQSSEQLSLLAPVPNIQECCISSLRILCFASPCCPFHRFTLPSNLNISLFFLLPFLVIQEKKRNNPKNKKRKPKKPNVRLNPIAHTRFPEHAYARRNTSIGRAIQELGRRADR